MIREAIHLYIKIDMSVPLKERAKWLLVPAKYRKNLRKKNNLYTISNFERFFFDTFHAHLYNPYRCLRYNKEIVAPPLYWSQISLVKVSAWFLCHTFTQSVEWVVWALMICFLSFWIARQMLKAQHSIMGGLQYPKQVGLQLYL